MIMAVEGETTESVDGWGTSELEVYFDELMQANYKFLTYGYYDEGAGYEGSGKVREAQFNPTFTDIHGSICSISPVTIILTNSCSTPELPVQFDDACVC